ncbi:type II secretion system F family protein [Streptomyces sp. NA02950]|uniref:type II secretion system F family protein n=1 Tax=Streptomyces sp. NA02950 TaxID=2742137 RepID=UPI0015908168|nr:type II secretion system F family protein [Streptomyces sp. NA02950]QKV90407.1 type II secretion system F family protein [Streptomyces sp. NA02950]QKV97260.1 type II secretion system F family protein [Streptomyces sp. NA02950]
MSTSLAVLSGCTTGAGFALLVRELLRPQPSLAAALQRTPPGGAQQSEAPRDRDAVWGRWLVDRFGDLPGVRIPTQNLALLQQTPERFVLTKVALAALGLLAPAVAATPWLLLGVGMPFYVPAVAGLAVATLLWIMPDLSVRDQAKRAREEFAHALTAYLDLVALKRSGGSGPTEAMERAAAVGKGWPFQLLQTALLRARVDRIPPWEALEELHREHDLPALEDIAEIMRRSAHDGAAVYTSLRARAQSLRTELLEAQAAEANANSERMTAPGALLAVLVMLLIAFPAVLRILET